MRGLPPFGGATRGGDELVVVGMDLSVPGADGVGAFEAMLFADDPAGRVGYGFVPEERLDRGLYVDPTPGRPGKTYTTLGGTVEERPVDRGVAPISDAEEAAHDPTHLRFCEVAGRAWASAGLEPGDPAWRRTGVYVGHSGGTKLGGPLSIASGIEESAELLDALPGLEGLGDDARRGVKDALKARVRATRPRATPEGPKFEAYEAASLAASALGLEGPRQVVDAACASSLVALNQARLAIAAGRVDAAVVGGATYNGSDNLILFSQSRACGTEASRPFDDRADGLVSSEGYVAVVVTTRGRAEAAGLDILASVGGLGLASDGRGKSLWAPRAEGQRLALQRAYPEGRTLAVDTLECHATSTSLGDATELEAIAAAAAPREEPLPVGSAKSNLGHTLEAAGLIGLVKQIVSMRRGERAPSAGFEVPSSRVDWDAVPVRVLRQAEPWPATGGVRTGAVSAFGIGGLNAHVWVRRGADASLPPNTIDLADEPIAVVGRGLVLAGCDSVDAFQSLTGTRLAAPPAGRWLNDAGLSDGPPRAFATPTNVGGYVTGWSLDGVHYRIPPKQVAQANPLQMMLLDAVAQAAREAGAPDDIGKPGVAWPGDPTRVGVTVGTVFGGEFSNQLQLGLRLPELTNHLAAILEERGLDPAIAEGLAEHVLAARPALLDETGSFTASTLASRVAKTFDLMGGAAAVDAGGASAMAALFDAADRLRGGQCDAMIVGTAQRSLDLPALERLDLAGCLARSGDPADVDGRRVLPGEGVAVLVLRRLSDALADGQTVYGVLDDFEASAAPARPDAADAEIARKVGHLVGSQAMLRAVSETPATAAVMLAASADDGVTLSATLRPHAARRPDASPAKSSPAKTHAAKSPPVTPRPHPPRTRGARRAEPTPPSLPSPAMLRLQAATDADFGRLVDGDSPAGVDRFAPGGVRAVLLGGDRAAQMAALRKAWDAGKRAAVLDREGVVLWGGAAANGADRVAWAFPGQGSQYAGVPASATTAAGRAAVSRLVEALDREGQAPVDFESPGGDVWGTQVWTLAASLAAAASLGERGFRPDAVVGHSFGECAAAVEAGAMTLDQAVRLSRWRADAVAMAGGGGLLSVRGAPAEVTAAAAAAGLDVHVSHHNAPTQTVLSGRAEDLASAKDALQAAGFASAPVPVAAAFHSPALAGAEAALRRQFSAERLRPPRCGMLSATSLAWLAEPEDVRESLVSQLTRPVRMAAAVRRLADAGVGLLAEVGPGRVLSKLAAECGGRLLCVATDGPRGLDLYAAAAECLTGEGGEGGEPRAEAPPAPAASNGRAEPNVRPESNGRASRVAVIDVRNGSAGAPPRGRLAEAPPREPHPEPAGHEAEPSPDAIRVSRPQTIAFLTDLVVSLTGYDPEVVDAEADLEADLGVDSIKKAQVIGELAEWAGLTKAPEDLRLDDVRTLAQIADLVDGGADETRSPARGADESLSGGGADASPPRAASPTSGGVALLDAPPQAKVRSEPAADARPPHAAAVTAASLDALMVDFVVDQTGYDPSVVDVEADLEADLGVDSIKQAQLLGEMHAQFGLDAVAEPGQSLSDFRTLRDIRELLLRRLGGGGVAQAFQPVPDAGDGARDSDDSAVTDGVAPADPAPPVTAEPVEARESSPATGTGWKARATGEADALADSPATLRFAMRAVPAPRRDGVPSEPTLAGDALIVGGGPLAEAIARRVKRLGRSATILDVSTVDRAEGALAELWSESPTPHLFLCTAVSEKAMTALDAGAWATRRTPAVEVPYRACQLWNQHAIDAGLMGKASVVACTGLGGSFGFDGEVVSPEGGAAGGLVKAMLIEGWMRGFRETPMKVIDVTPEADPDAAAGEIFAELAAPSYDMETATDGRDRRTAQAVARPLAEDACPAREITRGGAWVVSGGGRGITPLCAMALAERHGLKLHLLGTAPAPGLDEDVRAAYRADRSALRRRVMAEANAAGENGIEAWRRLEKAVEIHATLDDAAARGVSASYHQCDVSDAAAVKAVLDTVRAADGPVRGVVHGAGAGQDARFDRKRADKVDQCIRAKVDGCVALAEATAEDPLEWFVGFGSISGRFGANGHTDYSLANDMLAKCVSRLRRDRPGLAATTFHWHAWGDVGMATKPEARLTLEMIDMRFMPAEEGVAHFLAELEHGGGEPEVLITDRRYYRKFYPTDRPSDDPAAGRLPLLGVRPDGAGESAVTLDPKADAFLAEHRVKGRPTLPMVVAWELMAEAALRKAGPSGGRVVSLENVEALTALKFPTDDPAAVTVSAEGEGPVACRVRADVRRRDGRLVAEGREFFRGEALLRRQPTDRRAERPSLDGLAWQDVEYGEAEIDGEPAAIYHGPPLRALRRVAIGEDADGTPVGYGLIAAPAAVGLFGERRPGTGWTVGAAVADACLYAAAAHAFAATGRASLPVSVGRLRLGRAADPGEPCLVTVRTTKSGKKTARLSWTLLGQNGDVLLEAEDYRVAWVG